MKDSIDFARQYDEAIAVIQKLATPEDISEYIRDMQENQHYIYPAGSLAMRNFMTDVDALKRKAYQAGTIPEALDIAKLKEIIATSLEKTKDEYVSWQKRLQQQYAKEGGTDKEFEEEYAASLKPLPVPPPQKRGQHLHTFEDMELAKDLQQKLKQITDPLQLVLSLKTLTKDAENYQSQKKEQDATSNQMRGELAHTIKNIEDQLSNNPTLLINAAQKKEAAELMGYLRDQQQKISTLDETQGAERTIVKNKTESRKHSKNY